jgi:hypothetical protein
VRLRLQLRLFLANSPVRDQSLPGGGYIDRDTTTGKRRQLPVSSAVGRNRSRKKSHMRYENLLVLVLVGCVGCAAPYAPNPVVAQGLPNPGEPVLSQVTATPVAGNPDCHNYTALATIDGKQEKIVGKACRQSDGSWAIAEGPPTNPSQYTTVYWPPTDSYYADYEPWLWDAPIGISIGAPFFFDVHRHFHPFFHARHFGEFRHAGHFGEFRHAGHFGGFRHAGRSGGFHGGFSHRG